MSSPIRLIVGLGNPGLEYRKTRHNAGFWLTDLWADIYRGNWQGAHQGRLCSISVNGQKIWLLQPQTYMNRSGSSVLSVMQFYKLTPADLLVCHDELDLLPGIVRLKQGGGVAGHNGLKDIVRVLGGDAGFWRLRIGIGHPRQLHTQQNVADFVLHPPTPDDQKRIDESLTRISAQTERLVGGDFVNAMQVLHRDE